MPEKLFWGTATLTVGVVVNVPIPVFVAALKNLTAVGGVDPAGTTSG